MTPLTSSELILNKDGSVFHLGLRPENIADTILTVGDPGRADLIAKYFDKVQFRTSKREFRTITGELKGKQISVISTGIGTDNIDIVLNELVFLKRFNLEKREPINNHKLTLIRLGTTGSINNVHQLNDIIYSKWAISMDGLLHFYNHQWPELAFGENSYVVTSPSAELEKFFGDFRESLTLTASGFYAPQFRNAVVKPKYAYADIKQISYNNRMLGNIEMETAGIYGLAELFGLDAISISVVLANREDGRFTIEPEKAIVTMIEKVLERVCQLP